MLTNTFINLRQKADQVADCSLGNRLFRIAGVIGVAVKNGYDFGFPHWKNQEFFENKFPYFEGSLKTHRIPADVGNFDFGFKGFDFPDNVNLEGEFGSYHYFDHCADLIRYYFKMRPQCEPYKDTIIVHYRNYPEGTAWVRLGESYYKEALKKLPHKPVLVVTDNIDEAFKNTGLKSASYTSNNVITDFYILANAEYSVIANSTFSWWGAWLAQSETVAPLNWFTNELNEKIDLYLPNWTLI